MRNTGRGYEPAVNINIGVGPQTLAEARKRMRAINAGAEIGDEVTPVSLIEEKRVKSS